MLVSLDIHIICVQESWLDASVKNPILHDYFVACRRDRSETENRGGVITYTRSDVNNIVFYKASDESERVGHIIHRDSGAIALCNWYYPPCADLSHIASLQAEVEDIGTSTDTILLVGDLNVHHVSWLRFSNADTPRGRHLKEFCDGQGLRQLVSQPTRGDYLLDLVLSSNANVQVSVEGKIADHACLHIKVPDAK